MLKRYCLTILLVFVSSFALSHEPREGFDTPDWDVLAPMPDKGQSADFLAPENPVLVSSDAESETPRVLIVKVTISAPTLTAQTGKHLPNEVGWRSC